MTFRTDTILAAVLVALLLAVVSTMPGCAASNPHPQDDSVWLDAHPGQHLDDKGIWIEDSPELAAAKIKARTAELKLQQAQRDAEAKRKSEQERIEKWTKRGGICFWIIIGSLVAFAVIRGINASAIPFTSPINPSLFLTIALIGFVGDLYCIAAGAAEEHRGYIVAIVGGGVVLLALRELHATGGIGTFFGFNKKPGSSNAGRIGGA